MLPLIDTIGEVNSNNPSEAIRQIVEYIRRLEEQLYMILSNIDSSNMSGINLNDTEIKSENGSAFSKDKLILCGKNGEKIELGYDTDKGAFVCNFEDITANSLTVQKLTVQGSGEAKLYSDPSGEKYLQIIDKNGTTIGNW